MKKYIIIMTACLMSGVASGATSGFTSDCDMWLQYVSCVSQKVLTDLSKFSCDQLSDAFANYDETAAVNDCKQSADPNILFMSDLLGHDARQFVEAYLMDKCYINDVDLAVTNVEIANAVIAGATSQGFCSCKIGYYILARGITPGRWAIDAECIPCPSGGTSDSVNSIGLASCYIPAGSAFTDETGSGVYSENCSASYNSQQEQVDAYK